MEDWFLQPSRQPLMNEAMLSLQFLLRLAKSTLFSSSSLSIHECFSPITPVQPLSPLPLFSRGWLLLPLLLRVIRVGLETRGCECWLPVASTDCLESKIWVRFAGSVPPSLPTPVPSAAPPSHPSGLILWIQFSSGDAISFGQTSWLYVMVTFFCRGDVTCGKIVPPVKQRESPPKTRARLFVYLNMRVYWSVCCAGKDTWL